MSNKMSPRQIDTSLTFGRYKERIHVGPYGCGKTRSILLGFGLWCKTHKPGKLGFLLLGKTADLAKSNMGDTLAELFGSNFKYTQSKKSDALSKDALLFNHRIYFGGMHDKESIKRVLGKSYKAIIVDELTSISESNYKQLLGRLRGDKPHWIEASTNPDSPNHWLYSYLGLDNDTESKQIKYRQNRHIVLIQWTREDAQYDGAQDYYNDLIESFGVGSVYYNRGVLGHWCGSGDLVYGDSFRPNDHILDYNELINATYKYFKIGIDFGMENPTVALICGVMPMGEHIILDELYIPHAKNLDDLINKIINIYNKYYNIIGHCRGVYIDPSASVLIKGLKTNGLLNIHKANNDVVGGIQIVSTMYNTGKLYVTSNCKNYISEIYSYEWSDKMGETVKKVNDHAMDAVRYLCNA